MDIAEKVLKMAQEIAPEVNAKYPDEPRTVEQIADAIQAALAKAFDSLCKYPEDYFIDRHALDLYRPFYKALRASD